MQHPQLCDTCTDIALLRLGNDEIETQLRRNPMMAKNDIKMLLLGTGDSGKMCRFKGLALSSGLILFL